jgi:hypothetical protein
MGECEWSHSRVRETFPAWAREKQTTAWAAGWNSMMLGRQQQYTLANNSMDKGMNMDISNSMHISNSRIGINSNDARNSREVNK